MIKILDEKLSYRYTLNLRLTKKNFPKEKTIDWYIKRLEKTIGRRISFGPYTYRNRFSVYISDISELTMKRIIKKLTKIDDGILREVIRSTYRN